MTFGFYCAISAITIAVMIFVTRLTGIAWLDETGEPAYLEMGFMYIVGGVVWPFTIAATLFVGAATLLGFLGSK